MAFKMKGFPLHSGTSPARKMETPVKQSEYGKRHDRLRRKGHELQEESMDVFDAGNEKKSDRLQKRADRKFKKASKIRNSSAAKQKSADLKTLDELIEEGFTPADARRMQKDKAVTGEQKETDKQKMQRLEDEAAKANKAGDTEKAKKLMAQVSKLEDKIQGTTKPPTKQKIRRANFEPVEFMKEPMPRPEPPRPRQELGDLVRVEPPKMAPPRIEKQLSVHPDFTTMSITKGKRRSKVGKKLTKVANIFRKNKKSPDFK